MKYTWDEWIRKIANRDGNFFVLIKRNGEDIEISGQGFKFIDATTKQEIIDSVRSLASKSTKVKKQKKV